MRVQFQFYNLDGAIVFISQGENATIASHKYNSIVEGEVYISGVSAIY